MPVKGSDQKKTGISSTLHKKLLEEGSKEADMASQGMYQELELSQLEAYIGQVVENGVEAASPTQPNEPTAALDAVEENTQPKDQMTMAEEEHEAGIEAEAAMTAEELQPAAAEEEARPSASGSGSKKKPFKPAFAAKPAPKQPKSSSQAAPAENASPNKPTDAAKPAIIKKKPLAIRAVPADAAEVAGEEEAVLPAAKAEGSAKEPPTKLKPKKAKPAAAAAPKPAAAAKKAAAPKKPATEKADEGGPKIKRAKNAFNFFSDANRDKVKADNPEATFGGISKLLGTKWAALSDEEKAPYKEMAEADKQRYQGELDAAGIEKQPRAPKAAKEPKKQPAMSPFQLYCEEQKPQLAKENPLADAKELQKLLVTGWKELDELDRSVYEVQHAELKAQAAPSKKRAATEPATAASPAKKQKKGGSKGKQAKREEEEDAESAGAEAEQEDDADKEREAAEYYDEAPAEYIVSESGGKLVVLRQGKGFVGYGLVDAKAARMQRLGQGSGTASCPVSLEMLEEWESFQRGFKRAVHDSTEGSALDLELVKDGSPLEACYFLGDLRDAGRELSSKQKDDSWMRVPMLATCRLVQRMVDVERRRAQGLQAEAQGWKERALSAEVLLAGGSKPAAARRQEVSPGTQRKKSEEC